MTAEQADKFVRAASLLFVLRGDISSKKASYRLRQATAKSNGHRKQARRK